MYVYPKIEPEEAIVIERLKDKLNKVDILVNGTDFFIPTTRGQKGFDFVIYSRDKNNFLKMQVKSSLIYKNKKERDLWFKTFNTDNNNVDYYIFIGSYYKQKDTEYELEELIFIFKREEIISIFNKIRKDADSKVSFNFDFNDEKIEIRNHSDIGDLSEYLLNKKIKDIIEDLK